MLLHRATQRKGSSLIAAMAPVAWYRFGLGVTVTGAGVSQWDDASGNARHLLQGTDTLRPTKQGDGSVLFDGVDNVLVTAGFTLNQPTTIYLAMKQITWTNTDTFCDGLTAGKIQIFQRTGTPNFGMTAGAVLGDVSLALGTYGVVSGVFNGVSSSLQVNNAAPVNGDAGAGNAGGVALGALFNSTQAANIEVREVIVFAEAHGASTRGVVVDYLNQVIAA